MRSKIEWIYTRTKVSRQGSLELAQENERMTNGYFYTQLVQAYLNVSMDVWGLDRYFDVDHEYEC